MDQYFFSLLGRALVWAESCCEDTYCTHIEDNTPATHPVLFQNRHHPGTWGNF